MGILSRNAGSLFYDFLEPPKGRSFVYVASIPDASLVIVPFSAGFVKIDDLFSLLNRTSIVSKHRWTWRWNMNWFVSYRLTSSKHFWRVMENRNVIMKLNQFFGFSDNPFQIH